MAVIIAADSAIPDGFYWFEPSDERHSKTIVRISAGRTVTLFGNDELFELGTLDGTFHRVNEISDSDGSAIFERILYELNEAIHSACDHRDAATERNDKLQLDGRAEGLLTAVGIVRRIYEKTVSHT